MKISHFLFFVFLTSFSLSSMDSHANVHQCLSEHKFNSFIAQKGDKIYINPETIVLYENKIYLNVDNNPIPISALFSDSHGIYISKKREAKENTWVCPTCGWVNPSTSPVCQNTANHRLYEPDKH